MPKTFKSNGTQAKLLENKDLAISQKTFDQSNFLDVHLAVSGNIALVRCSMNIKKTLNKGSTATLCKLGVNPLYKIYKRMVRNDSTDFAIEINLDGTLKLTAFKSDLNIGDSVNFTEMFFISGGVLFSTFFKQIKNLLSMQKGGNLCLI